MSLSPTALASETGPARAETGWPARLWGALFALCGALFLDGLDVSMVGVTLPSIRSEFHLSTSTLQWVMSGYALGYGGLLLLGGRAADLLGRRRVFLIAIAVFAVASLLGGFASSPALLVATRFIKGTSAAFTAPAGLSIITTTFPEGPARNRALSIYTAFGASGFSMGLVLGGLMTEVGWRWTFLLPAPIAVAVLIAGLKLIPRQARPAAETRRYDAAGAATSTAALLLLVYAIVEAPARGWTSPTTVGSFALGALLLGLFVAIERKVPAPLVRLGILRSGSLVRANLGAMVAVGSYIGFQFIAALYMQALLGWSPLKMAMALLPGGLLVAFGGPRAAALVNRFGAPRVVAVGMAAFVAAYTLFLRIDVVPQYLTTVLPTMILVGIGFALAFPALNIQATAGVRDDEQGLASSLLQTSFQIGGALVVAAVSAVIAAGQVEGTSTPETVLASYRPALVLVAGVAAFGFATAMFGVGKRRAAASAQRVRPQRGVTAAVVLAAGAGALMGLSGCDRMTSSPAVAAAPPAPPVTVAAVEEREVNEWDELSGRLEAVEAVEVRPRVSGTISRVTFAAGSEVRQGQILFEIDARPYQADVARAEAEVAQARSAAELASRAFSRGQALLDKGAITREDFENREAAHARGAAGIRAAEAALALARLNLEWTHVRSPISGRVGRAEVTAGNLVQAGQGGNAGTTGYLTTVVSQNPIYASFEADEQSYLRYVSQPRGEASAGAAKGVAAHARPAREKAKAVAVSLGLANEDGFPHKGTIDFVDNHVDPRTGTVRMRAVFANDERLFVPGLYARVRLAAGDKHRAVLVSDRAVGTDQDKKFVLVLKSDETLEYRPIELGRLVDGYRVVKGGLRAGERIVVNGLQHVRPGMKVAATTGPMLATR